MSVDKGAESERTCRGQQAWPGVSERLCCGQAGLALLPAQCTASTDGLKFEREANFGTT